MNVLNKIVLSVAAVAFAALAAAQTASIYNGQIRRAVPTTIQHVIRVNGHIIPVGPKLPYNDSFRMRVVGTSIFDAFEASATGKPTDLNYLEHFMPDLTDGTRWYNGATFVNTFFAQGVEAIYPGTAAKMVMGVDTTIYNNPTGNPITDILVFTSDDVYDPNSPVAPSNLNDGVDLGFSPGLAPGGWYTNADLTTLGGIQGFATGNGWFAVILASGLDGMGNPIEASSAQPLLWGTKIGDNGTGLNNKSVLGSVQATDGTGTGTDRSGSLNTLWDYRTGVDSMPTDYTVTRGAELGTHNGTNIQGNAGQAAVIQQRIQPGPTFNNAEITTTVTLDPTTDPTANLRMLRVVVRAKANALSLSDALADYSIKILNNVTSVYDTVYDSKPTNPAGDGTLTFTASIAKTSIANYIAGTSTRTVTVRIGVRHGRPALSTWSMKVNLVRIQASAFPPDPLGPAFGFSAP